jgi:16S rRNA (uracil1498-N3)-methyltransferase
MRCFYCKNIKYGEIDDDLISAREKKHLFKILRGEVNEKILLINGEGIIATATIKKNNSIVVDNIETVPKPTIKLHLFVAPPRKNQMDQLLKQCSEIGVWSITPILTERSVSKPIKTSSLERMHTLLIEGCKQAHNPFTPIIKNVIKISNIESEITKCPHSYFGSTKKCGIEARSNNLFDMRNSQTTLNIGWIVGPEGGFTNSEEEMLINLGIKPLQFGQWVLRVETAAIIGASNLIEKYHDSIE